MGTTQATEPPANPQGQLAQGMGAETHTLLASWSINFFCLFSTTAVVRITILSDINALQKDERRELLLLWTADFLFVW